MLKAKVQEGHLERNQGLQRVLTHEELVKEVKVKKGLVFLQKPYGKELV
tara:strand:- start:203 stop:349 length:147 start_codon:yes stop_codon:yes gene_type:complete